MFVALIVLLISTLVFYVLFSYKRAHYYFERRGIKYVPGVPLFGNTFKSTFLKRHYVEDLNAVYKAYPNEKYVGFIEGTSPIIVIRDPEIIKLVTVKNFDHFSDHKQFFDEETEPLFGGSIFSMKGDRWRDMRTTLSPAFTSSKMRLMMPFMVDISTNILNHLKDHTNEDIDINDLMRRYTNDVIASTAFGVEVNSLKDKENEFYTTGQNMFVFTFLQNVYFIVLAMFPTIFKKLGIQIFPARVTQFFKTIVEDTMKYREKNNIVRPDMIQLLMEASKGSLKAEKEESDLGNEDLVKPDSANIRQWSDRELIGQVFIFFVAGFESSASALVLSVHELALDSGAQEKLYQEIKKYHDQHGQLKFDTLSSMKYLDCVVNETLRKWSPGIFMDRACTKAYELPPPREGDKPIKINPGEVVYNMMNTIHTDAKYYPNPEVFDPDRFSDDKQSIQPFTFMPFGMGPRACIGVRFAVLEVKVLLYYLILNFKILKSEKTADPIMLKPHNFCIAAQNGSWVRIEPRKENI